jgi:hypothetical protein
MQSKPLTSSKEFHDQYLGTFEMPRQSELLTQFYRAYAAWLDAGAPKEMGFSRHHGLCGALRQWANRHAQVEYRNLGNELQAQFMKLSTSFLHPFHELSSQYNLEADRGACHRNPKRIAWAREHAK